MMIRRTLCAAFYILTLCRGASAAATTTLPVVDDDSSSFEAVRKYAASDGERVLNVHVVPHTHDDVGWRKTVEQYYHGYNDTIDTRGAVSEILTSTVTALTQHSARTFTYAEMKFFTMWWAEQSDAVKDTVHFLVANRQLTFVNGGWCMHDEASTHFIGMVDQTTLGHQFLLREFNVCPKTGWQLDPFGHSSTHANLLVAGTGMKALYFGRIDYQDLALRKKAAECEGLWKPTTSSTISTFWGLTGSYGGNYGPPDGFCFDVLCNDAEPLVSANTTRQLQRITNLLQKIKIQSDQTKGNHILLTMGTDFTYKKAQIDYSNMDVMIGLVMNYQQWNMIDISTIFGGSTARFDRVNMFYSSPDYYTEQKLAESSSSSSLLSRKRTSTTRIEWPVKTDDFFPYSDCPHCFWTGYFTSRTAFKRFERVASSFLLAARQIDALPSNSAHHESSSSSDNEEEEDDEKPNPLFPLEDALGIAQHHDAVSGTAKQHVADDYSKKLSHGVNTAALATIQKLKSIMLSKSTTTKAAASSTAEQSSSMPLENLSYCPLLNETICQISEEASAKNDTVMYVLVYNPLASNRSSVVRLPVSSDASFRVERVGEERNNVQFIPSFRTDSVYSNSTDDVKYVLTFGTGDLPPVGAVAFRVVKESEATKTTADPLVTPTTVTARRLRTENSKHEEIKVSNGIISAAFDRSTGMIIGLSSSDGTTLPVQQTWGYYTSYDNTLDQSDSKQNSGAYIFRPKTPEEKLVLLSPKVRAAKFVNTTVGYEVHAFFHQSWLKQVTRVVANQAYVEMEYTIGPIPISNGRGKEIVSRLSTPIKSNSTFYTDSNGREFQKRRRNYRPSWDLDVYEPIAGNYYPVNAAIYIEDVNASLAVLVDRSQGGASLLDGSVELMVQRRTVADDARGVDEPLNETMGGMNPYPPFGKAERIGGGVVIRGKHRITIGKGPVGAKLARSEMDAAFAEPLVFVGSAPVSDPVTFQKASFSGLREALPKNVMLITFMRLPNPEKSKYLLRLGHQFADGEDKSLSKPVEVDLTKLLSGFNVTSVAEKSLSGNQFIADNRQLQCSSFSKTSKEMKNITILPMQVRTFEIFAIPAEATM